MIVEIQVFFLEQATEEKINYYLLTPISIEFIQALLI